MLKSKKLKTDSLVSNEDLTNLIMNQALEQIATLTGVSKAQALVLMANQLSHEAPQQTTVFKPILEQDESTFIRHLFN